MVAPGADPGRIVLGIAGVAGLRLDEDGGLLASVEGGEVRLGRPLVYQLREGTRHEVEGGFRILGDDRIGFAVGPYEATAPLVIDPVLDYSSYLGGSGADAAYAVTVDAAGYVYAAGTTLSGDFPTDGPAQAACAAACGQPDAFVSKFDPTLAGAASLVYATYLGGAGGERARAVAVDASGAAQVAGDTTSSDFPVANGFQTASGFSTDGFFVKLSADGGTLLYGTYIGGNDTDEAMGVAVNAAGVSYVSGRSASTDFVTTADAVQRANAGIFDAFVMTIDTGQMGATSRRYSTLLGGGNSESAEGLAIDAAGRAYITGDVLSGDFPIVNGFQRVKGVGRDAYLAAVDPLVSGPGGLVYSTYIGGSRDENGGIFDGAVAVDPSGRAYVTGTTQSDDFPVTAGAFQPARQGGDDAFVVGVDPAKVGAASLLYATYLGSIGAEQGAAIAVDAGGYAVVAGSTLNAAFPVTGGGTPHAGGWDAFVSRLRPDGSGLVFSTLVGGSASEFAYAVAVDPAGGAVVAGATNSGDFPVSSGAFQSAANGSGYDDAFVSRISPDAMRESTDLAITMADAPDPVPVGDPIGYSIVVSNVSTAGATGVRVIDVPPGGVSFVSATASQGSCDYLGGAVECSLGSLAAGAAATVEVVFSPAVAGIVVNTATVTSVEQDADPSNNRATVETEVRTTGRPPAWITHQITITEPDGVQGETSPVVRASSLEAEDPDEGETLTFSIDGDGYCTVGIPTHPFGAPALNPLSVPTGPGNETIEMRLMVESNDAAGSPYCVRVTVSDGVESATQDITVHVIAQNESPTWLTTSVTVDEPIGTEPDPVARAAGLVVEDPDDGQTLTFTVDGAGYCDVAPTHPFTSVAVDPASVATAPGQETTHLNVTVGANDADPNGVTPCVRVTVSDGFDSVTQDVRVLVVPKNSAPGWVTTAVTVDEPMGPDPTPIKRLAATLVDDRDANQTLTFSIAGDGSCGATPTHPFATGPDGTAGVAINPTQVDTVAGSETTDLELLVGANDAAGSPHCVRVTVSDGSASTTQDLAVAVVEHNQPPAWVTAGVTTAEPAAGEPDPVSRSVLLTVDDVDAGQTFTFGVVGAGYCGADPTHPFTDLRFSPSILLAGAGALETSLQFPVGSDDSGTHCVRVSVSDGFDTVTHDLTVTVQAEPPSIVGFAPASGVAGTLVTITGSGLSGLTAVRFNAEPATFATVSDTTITAVVPPGATTGAIGVTGPDGSAVSAQPFTVLPAIDGFFPSRAWAGETVTIDGTGLNGVVSVTFNHHWHWVNGAGQTEHATREAISQGTYWESSVEFSADGLNAGDVRQISLTACSDIAQLGTCASSVLTLSIVPAPPPVVTCSLLGCQVRAGRTMEIHGDSSAAGFRYHEWTWVDASGQQVSFRLDTQGALASDRTFSAAGFDGSATTTVPASLKACTQKDFLTGDLTGSCSSTSVALTVLPAIPATIACAGGQCTVEAGSTLVLAGDSQASGLRYHAWRWLDAAGQPVAVHVDGGATAQSQVTFSAAGFSGAATRTASLTTCGDGFDLGTCVTSTREIQITPAPPVIESFTPTEAVAGTTITITGRAFSGATAVTVGGVAASFTVVSDTSIVAVVPEGAVTGTIGVTTTAGTVASASTFTVRAADTTPPVLTTPTPMILEATGPEGAVATFTASADDAVDGAIAPLCTPASGDTFPLGATTVTCTASDSHGNLASATFLVTVVDTTPPVLSLPAPITVDATSLSGAVVTFTASAVDLVDGMRTVTCAPGSGSTFPEGTTTVSCTASDLHANFSYGSFAVTVQAAPEIVSTLIADVVALGFNQSSNLLRNVLESVDRDNITAACNQLGAFINQVMAQAGRALTVAEAATLIESAENARGAIGCAAAVRVPQDARTIQAAIDMVPDGGIVRIAAGTYAESVDIAGKRVDLIGEDRATTIIRLPAPGEIVSLERARGLVNYGEGGGGLIANLSLVGGDIGIAGATGERGLPGDVSVTQAFIEGNGFGVAGRFSLLKLLDTSITKTLSHGLLLPCIAALNAEALEVKSAGHVGVVVHSCAPPGPTNAWASLHNAHIDGNTGGGAAFLGNMFLKIEAIKR